MRSKNAAILFYVNLTLITLVNSILIYGLFSHFVLKQSVEQILWLLTVFSAEVLGCFVFGWHKIFSSDIRPIIFNEDEKPKFTKTESGKVEVEINLENYDETNPESENIRLKACKFINEMRKFHVKSLDRIKFAKKAKFWLNKLPKTGIYKHIYLYNSGTIEMELGNFDKAHHLYEQAKEILYELSINPLDIERRLAYTEMMVGNVFDYQNRNIEARLQYLKSWTIKPNFLTALNLFELSFKTKSFSEMKVWYDILTIHEEFNTDNYKPVVRSINERMNTKDNKFQ